MMTCYDALPLLSPCARDTKLSAASLEHNNLWKVASAIIIKIQKYQVGMTPQDSTFSIRYASHVGCWQLPLYTCKQVFLAWLP